MITNTPEPVIRSSYTLAMLADRISRIDKMMPFFGLSPGGNQREAIIDSAKNPKAAIAALRSVGVS